MSKTAAVYLVMNEINGKAYVGSSIDIVNRWRQWRYSAKAGVGYQSLLVLAFDKYGIENFTFMILEECEATKEALLEREQFYIDTLKPDYNLLPTAGSRLGSKSSPETIEKLRNKRHTEEWKQQASIRQITYMNQPEIKAKYSELRKGKTFAEIFGDRVDEIYTKQSAGRTGKHVGFDPWNKGVPMDEEQRIKLSEIRKQRIADGLIVVLHGFQDGHVAWNKGIPWSDEMKQKLSEAHIGQVAWNLGVPMTEAQKQRLSQIAKENFDPEHQQRITEAARQVNLGKERSEETKRRISESNLTSAARKAFADSRRGIPRTDEAKQNMSIAQQNSEAVAAYHEGRIGKRRGNGSSGHAGVSWDKNREKWMVRFKGKTYGRFENLEDAVARSQEVLASVIGAA